MLESNPWTEPRNRISELKHGPTFYKLLSSIRTLNPKRPPVRVLHWDNSYNRPGDGCSGPGSGFGGPEGGPPKPPLDTYPVCPKIG